METHCVSFKKIILIQNSSFRRNKQNSSMLVSNCTIFGKKLARLTKNHEASRLELY